MRISDWSSDVCSSDLHIDPGEVAHHRGIGVGVEVVGVHPLLGDGADGEAHGGDPIIGRSRSFGWSRSSGAREAEALGGKAGAAGERDAVLDRWPGEQTRQNRHTDRKSDGTGKSGTI